MGYPRRLLDDDETVVLELHPHWRRLVLPALLVPVVVGLGAYLASIVEGSASTPVRIAIVVVGLAVLLALSVAPFLRWLCTLYVVTDRRIALRTGVLNRSGRDVPLSRVNDVTFEHSVVERVLFKSGTLTVESAGERGQVELDDVPRVEDVQATIYRLAEQDDERRRGGPAPAARA